MRIFEDKRNNKLNDCLEIMSEDGIFSWELSQTKVIQITKKKQDIQNFFFMKLIGFINKLKMTRRHGLLREKYCSIPDGD